VGGSVLAAGAAASAGSAGAAGEGGKAGGDQPGGRPAEPVAGAPGSPIPAKYQVKKADGTLDADASMAKWAEGHKHLEQRLGSGTAPPASPDDYKVEAPGLDWEAFKSAPENKALLKAAHAKGMTNDQLAWALGEYAQRMAAAQPTPEKAFSELQQAWKTPTEFHANARHAAKALAVFGDTLTDQERQAIDSSPVVLRLLAKVGAQLGEDSAPIVEGTPAAQSWDEQMAAIKAHPGFMDALHPEHKQLVAKQQALYDRRYGPKKAPAAFGR